MGSSRLLDSPIERPPFKPLSEESKIQPKPHDFDADDDLMNPEEELIEKIQQIAEKAAGEEEVTEEKINLKELAPEDIFAHENENEEEVNSREFFIEKLKFW